jgi:hypothetical protein
MIDHNPYSEEVKVVQHAITLLRAERNQEFIRKLEEDQKAAGTSLEWYGITKITFEQFISSRSLSDNTRKAHRAGVHAVRVIFGSATR